MKRRIEWKNVLCGLGALLCFGLLYAVTFQDSEQKGQQTADIVVFGDSVFTDIGDIEAIPDKLAEALGVTVYNASMGGTCAARLEEERRQDSAKGSMSLAGLTKAVRALDFRVQQSARLRESNTEPFPGIVDGLAEVDFDRVETVLIGRGLNDYHAGIPVENPEDLYDEYTFLGALRSTVRNLQERNPDMRIILVTPIYTWYREWGLPCEEVDNGGGILEDYVNAELELAQELNVEAVDLYHDFFPQETLEEWEQCTVDGLHPNEAGREKIVEEIVKLLKP